MKIKGLDKALRALTIDESVVLDALEKGGKMILDQAKDNVHVLTGDLRNSLNMFVTKNENGWVVNVGSDLFYAAYEEFGSGENVKLPPEVSSEYGMQFYVSGKGHNFAHPYLHPAYRQHRDRVVKLIQDSVIKSLGK